MGGVTSYVYAGRGRSVSGYGGTVVWSYPKYAQGSSDNKVATASVSPTSESQGLWCDAYTDLNMQVPSYPMDSEIIGIEVLASCWASLSDKVTDKEVRLLKITGSDQEPVGANRARGDYWSGSATQRKWGSTTDTWGLTPQQLDGLLGADVDYFGVAIRVTAPGGSAIAKVDSVAIRVAWRYRKPVINSLSVTSPDASTLAVTANTSKRVTHTQWWIRHKDSATFTYLGEVTGKSITIGNLVGGSQYYVQCVARNEDQSSDPFVSTVLTTAGTAPAVQVADILSTSVTLQASATGTVNGYRWWFRPVGGATWTDTGTTTGNTKTIDGLTPNTQYEFRVQPFSDEATGRVGNYATASATTVRIQVTNVNYAATVSSLALEAVTIPDVTHTEWWLRSKEVDIWASLGEVAGVAYTITNLISGSQYYVRVRARAGSNVGDIAEFGPFSTTGTPPSATITEITQSSVTVQASASGSVTGYRWWLKEYGGEYLDQGVTLSNTKTFTNLDLANKTYVIKARPYYNESTGRIGNAAEVDTLVRGVVVTNATNSSLALTALVAPGVTHTTWWFRHKDSASWTSLGEVSGTAMTISNLIAGSQYYVQVQARTASQQSSPIAFGPFATTGDAPTLTATEVYPTSVTLQASAGGAVAGYRWWQRVQGGSWSDAGTTTSATRTFSSLTPGTVYEFRIRPYYNESTGRVGNYATTVNVPPPPAPGNVSAQGTGPYAITVACSPVESAVLYRFEVAPMNTESWTEFATSSTPSAVATLDKMNTQYRFRVRAQNQYGGVGPYSSTVSAYTQHKVDGTVRSGSAALSGVTVVEFSWPDLVQATTQITPRGRAVTNANGEFSITSAGDGTKRALVLLKAGYAGRMYFDVAGAIACELLQAVPRASHSTWYAVEYDTAPLPNHSVQAVLTGITAAILRWHRRARILSEQEVQIDTAPAFTAPITLAAEASASELALPLLSEFTTYYARVRTKRGSAASAWTGPISFRTGVSLPFGIGASAIEDVRRLAQEQASYGLGHDGQAPWGWKGQYFPEFGLGCGDTLGYGATEEVGLSEGIDRDEIEAVREEDLIVVSEEVQ